MTRDYVYPLRAGGNYEELRYSLRSLANMPDVGQLWVVGSKPIWLKHVNHIPSRPGKAKWANIVDAIREACDQREMSQEFVYMNDDFMVLQPVPDLRPMHAGSTYLVPGYSRMGGGWNRGHRDTLRVLRDLGWRGDPLYYELHVPMVFDKAKMAAVLDAAAAVHVPARVLQYRSLYGNWYGIGGDMTKDCKPGVSLSSKSQFDKTYLSTSDTMFTARRSIVVDFLKERFPEPSKYEI